MSHTVIIFWEVIGNGVNNLLWNQDILTPDDYPTQAVSIHAPWFWGWWGMNTCYFLSLKMHINQGYYNLFTRIYQHTIFQCFTYYFDEWNFFNRKFKITINYDYLLCISWTHTALKAKDGVMLIVNHPNNDDVKPQYSN